MSGGHEHTRERLVAKDSQRRLPSRADPVDRTRRAPTDLLAAHEFYQPLGFEQVQLPVERPGLTPPQDSTCMESARRRSWWPCIGPCSVSRPRTTIRDRLT